jgi:Rap1 Myb domain/TRF2-interacting telomeric protein/Rap1 - C terminal domain/BRCT domain, a BRCA1 C-terminus domain
MAPTVYNGVRNDDANPDGLFVGQKFWLSSTVPQRSRFIDDIKANGGEVVSLEKQAKVCLYDHARKKAPPGMYSYQYVELSVRKGQLEDLEAHRIGSHNTRSDRPVGSVTLPPKGSRTFFTEADDQTLWEWVKPNDGLGGAAGNLIYKQLEAVNPRHTYQSWRDRWLKYVQFQKRDYIQANGQRRREAAPEEAHPTAATAAPRDPLSRIDGPSRSLRIVVEVPLRKPAKQGRGRPRNNQLGELDNDTIRVISPRVSERLQTLTRPMLKENVDTLQVEGSSTATSESNTGSPKFSEEDRAQLLSAVEAILDAESDEVCPAWEPFAAEYPSHTAEQWRKYFYEVIVPYHHQQKRLSMRTGMKKVEAELRGQSERLNSMGERGEEKQEEGDEGMSSATKRQNGTPPDKPTAVNTTNRQSSPSFEPQSPVAWKSDDDVSRPASDHSRKGSPAKSKSQEPGRPDSQSTGAEETQTLSQSSEVEQHIDEHTRIGYSRPAKRRKLSSSNDTPLEIPSTPQPIQESETPEALAGTPTPRARKRPSDGLGSSWSPLFVPSDSEDEGSSLPTPKHAPATKEAEIHTSPISVHLVSDRGADMPSTSKSSKRSVESRCTSSLTPDFETAPDFPPIQPDNSEEQGEASDEFDTAAEEQQQQQRQPASRTPILHTQALLAAPIQEIEEGSIDLGLAEPEGGWDAIEGDDDKTSFSSSTDLQLQLSLPPPPRTPSPTPSTTSTTSTLNLSLDTWFRLRTDTHGPEAAPLLLDAAQATTLHLKLADEIYAELEAGRGIPSDRPGVWTGEDDRNITGMDARAIERVMMKHGRRAVEERLQCLEVWGR